MLYFNLRVLCTCLSYQEFFQLEWLIPDNNHELLWDHGMCADTSRGAAVRDLIAKALKGPLLPAQYEVLRLNSNLIHTHSIFLTLECNLSKML